MDFCRGHRSRCEGDPCCPNMRRDRGRRRARQRGAHRLGRRPSSAVAIARSLFRHVSRPRPRPYSFPCERRRSCARCALHDRRTMPASPSWGLCVFRVSSLQERQQLRARFSRPPRGVHFVVVGSEPLSHFPTLCGIPTVEACNGLADVFLALPQASLTSPMRTGNECARKGVNVKTTAFGYFRTDVLCTVEGWLRP